MKASTYLAVDLGAESGRVMSGTLSAQGLLLAEVHRFPNGGVRLGEHLYWNFLHLWNEIKVGLQVAGSQSGSSQNGGSQNGGSQNGGSQNGGSIQSIGLDTWGVDFGLLDSNDNLIGNPHHYRDSRTDGMMDAAFEIFPRDKIYAQTGIQFMQFNSLYQLFAMVQANDPMLLCAETFLNMSDLFNFFLTGEKANEFTIATTTQCYNPSTRDWASDLLSALNIPNHIFGEIVPPGSVLGKLRSSVAAELGLTGVSVVASAGHDTASAVAAVPASIPDYIYLSSGTWSLMGVELDEPMISAETLAANMTNEGGVGDKIRFLKNIVGLWLVQECRRQWVREGMEFSYADIVEIASRAPSFGSLVLPGDSRFLAPSSMPAAIRAFCKDTGQTIPEDKGSIIRCALESLALEYRWVAEQIDHLTGVQYPVIHIIGGGSQNKLLNQFAANATGRIVIAGPVEATAIGNILVQAIGLGEISSLAEGHEIVCNSFDVQTYEPQDTAPWDEAYQRYLKLKEMKSDL